MDLDIYLPFTSTALASSGGVLQCLLHSPMDVEDTVDVDRIPFLHRLHSLTSNLGFNALPKDSSTHWLQGLGIELPIFQLDNPLYQLSHGRGICYYFQPDPYLYIFWCAIRFVIDSVDCVDRQPWQCWISCESTGVTPTAKVLPSESTFSCTQAEVVSLAILHVRSPER